MTGLVHQISALSAKSTFNVTTAGQLALGVNDAGVDNNAGAYEATIRVDRR